MKTDPTPQATPWQEQTDDSQGRLDAAGIDEALKGQYTAPKNEEIAQQRREFAGRIRDRDPLDLAHNTERVLGGIERFYVESGVAGKRGMGKALARARRRRQLRRKADMFARTFEKTVFSDIEHTAPELGDEVELKSPATLAKEAGLNVDDKAKHSGGLDIAIGNTDYVFANAKALASVTSLFGKARYKITSDEGYVVPTDIHYMHHTRKVIKQGDYGVTQLELYADNIHTIADFKKTFALYSAALFDSPEEALGFYQTYEHVMSEAKRWDLDAEPGDNLRYNRWSIRGPYHRHGDTELGRSYADDDGKANDKSHAIALSMRQLLEQYNIYPPIEPEFQFKDKVAATRSW